MITAKAKIRVHDDYESMVPVLIPELDDVRRFASDLHAQAKPWAGDAFGWSAEYHPQQANPPLDSHLRISASEKAAFGSTRSCGSMAKTPHP